MLFYVGVGLIVIGVLVYMFILQDSGPKPDKDKANEADVNPEEMTDEQKAEKEKL